jgi:hypothetical protein
VDETGIIVSMVEPLNEPDAAEIMLVPVDTAVVSPSLPEALLIVAMPVFEELHVTEVVISFVLLSVKMPVAV